MSDFPEKNKCPELRYGLFVLFFRFCQILHYVNNETQSARSDLRNNDDLFFRVEDQTEKGEGDPNESHHDPGNLIEFPSLRAVIAHGYGPPFDYLVNPTILRLL
jgi:hypothetical protein